MKLQILSTIVAMSMAGASATAITCDGVQTIYQSAACCSEPDAPTCAQKLEVDDTYLELNDATGILKTTSALTDALNTNADDIDAEATTARAAESAANDRIDAEAARAIVAEEENADAIADIINGSTSALDSLSELVNEFKSLDDDLSLSITELLGTHTSRLDTLNTTLTGDITANTWQIGQHTSQIGQHTSQIGQHTSQIGANAAAISLAAPYITTTSSGGWTPGNRLFFNGIADGIAGMSFESFVDISDSLSVAGGYLTVNRVYNEELNGCSGCPSPDLIFRVQERTSGAEVYIRGNMQVEGDVTDFRKDVDVKGILSTNGQQVTSDSRIKKDIVDADIEDALQKVRDIELKEYGYTNPRQEGEKTVGFIAQQVKEVYPDAIAISDRNDTIWNEAGEEVEISDLHRIKKDKIYALHHGAIQSLDAKIAALEARLAALEA